MRKVVLFIAMSLDGYIADVKGNVDWLTGENIIGESVPDEDMDSYGTFIKDVDTVIMGWNTYHQVVTELSPDEWVYQDLMSYVMTHREMESTENIRFVQDSPCELVKSLKQEDGKDIWICGGASIVNQLMQADLIDKFYISVIPTILGDGIRLFETSPKEVLLKLVQTQKYNGIVDLVYERR